MKDNEKIAYLAGLIDGEGHFYRPLSKNGRGDRYYQFRIVISQSTRTVLEWAKIHFGGCVTTLKTKDGYTSYQWVLCGKGAEALAREMSPFLIVKKDQLQKVFNDVKTINDA